MKTKFYSIYGKAVDGDGNAHYVTVVGKFTQHYFKQKMAQTVPVEVKPGHIIDGELSFNKKTLHRKLTVGIAICSPEDKFDEETGIKVAKSRIEKGRDAGSVETNDVTMLTEDLIMSELVGKLAYVCANIEDFIDKL